MSEFIKPRQYGEPIHEDAPGFNPQKHRDLVEEVNEALGLVRTEVHNALGGKLVLASQKPMGSKDPEWGEIQNNTNYTLAPAASAPYTDAGRELLNGILPANYYGDPGWVGWSVSPGDQVTITLTFPLEISIKEVQVYCFDGGVGGILSPSKIEARTPGGVWQAVDVVATSNAPKWIVLPLTGVHGQVLEVRATARSGSGWIFIGEVALVAGSPPEPITVEGVPEGFSVRDENFDELTALPSWQFRRYSVIENATRKTMASAYMRGGDAWRYTPPAEPITLPPTVADEPAARVADMIWFLGGR